MGPQHLIAKSADSMGEQVLGRGLMARGPTTLSDTQRHTATHSDTQQHSATLSDTQRHTATLSNTQRHSATHSDTQQHTATLSNTQRDTLTCKTSATLWDQQLFFQKKIHQSKSYDTSTSFNIFCLTVELWKIQYLIFSRANNPHFKDNAQNEGHT